MTKSTNHQVLVQEELCEKVKDLIDGFMHKHGLDDTNQLLFEIIFALAKGGCDERVDLFVEARINHYLDRKNDLNEQRFPN